MVNFFELFRGNISSLMVDTSFYKFEYSLTQPKGHKRVGVVAWPDYQGENNEPESTIARDIFQKEQYQGTPWPRIFDAVDHTHEGGTFTVFLDTETWRRPDALEVRDAFMNALRRHGCHEAPDSANPQLWVRPE